MREREYRPGEDDAEIIRMRAKVWGADHPHSNMAFYKWLFQDGPEGPGSGIVTERDGAIAGFAAYVPRAVWHGSQKIPMAHGLEFMIDPDIGSMGSGRVAVRMLLKHAALAEKSGAAFTLNYPNENSYKMLVSARCGYETVFEPSLYMRPLAGYGVSSDEQSSMLKRLVQTLGGRGLSLYSQLRSTAGDSSFEVTEVEEFDDRFDAFFERQRESDRLQFDRCARSLTWRYRDNPLYEYEIVVAQKNGKLAGYAVSSTRYVFGTNACLVCDIKTDPSHPDAGPALVRELVHRAQSSGSGILVTQALPLSDLVSTLVKSGFLKVPDKINPKRFRMVCRAFTDAGTPATTGSAWSFAWGDMDVV